MGENLNNEQTNKLNYDTSYIIFNKIMSLYKLVLMQLITYTLQAFKQFL